MPSAYGTQLSTHPQLSHRRTYNSAINTPAAQPSTHPQLSYRQRKPRHKTLARSPLAIFLLPDGKMPAGSHAPRDD